MWCCAEAGLFTIPPEEDDDEGYTGSSEPKFYGLTTVDKLLLHRQHRTGPGGHGRRHSLYQRSSSGPCLSQPEAPSSSSACSRMQVVTPPGCSPQQHPSPVMSAGGARGSRRGSREQVQLLAHAGSGEAEDMSAGVSRPNRTVSCHIMLCHTMSHHVGRCVTPTPHHSLAEVQLVCAKLNEKWGNVWVGGIE